MKPEQNPTQITIKPITDKNTPKIKKTRVVQYVRFAILSVVLGGSMLLSYLHLHGGSQYPSIHAICPLGGLENLWAWFAGKGNLQKLFSGTMTLFFFTFIFAVLFGRAFCGNICPFGFLQELVGKISKRKFTVSEKADKILRFGKYIVLGIITVMAWITATIWISPYDPWTAFAHIWSGAEIFAENGIGFVILVIVLVAAVFIDRFFCKYLCPAGALYGVTSKISPVKIKRDKCSNCGQCSRKCPMNIDVSSTNAVTSAECIACGECVNACPSKNAEVKITVMGKVIKPLTFVVLTVGIFFGSIVALDAVGLMQVTVPTIESVSASGNYLKVADLRGSMTIEMGAAYTGMELSAFYELMEIPEGVPKDTQLKYVAYYVPGYDFHAIKARK